MKKRLINPKKLMQFALSLCLILVSTFASWGQQVIGSYPVMDGGFEAQTVGTLPATVTGTVFSTWTYGTAGTTAISDTGSGTTGPRTGSKYAVVTVSSTTAGRQLLSPMSATVPSGSHVVQYYTRNAVNMRDIPVGIGPTGTGYAGDGKNTTSTWAKVTQVVTPTSTTAATSYTAFRARLSTGFTTGGFDVDDVVIYAGSSADGEAPAAASGGTVNGLDVSWIASSNFDGGGYMVVRYSTMPQPDNDPNANGIYAVGNTITSGVVPLTGTVVYIGTGASGTSFTDAVTGSVSGSDYYKIYTVDKAFNYATEIVATAVVSSTPAITSSTETLTGFNYTGVGPSTSQSFLVSGSNLTNNLVVSTTSTAFELSTDNFATAGVSSITLSSPTVASTTLYVRLKANLIGGSKSATVTIASTGANTLPTLSLSGSATNIFYYNGSGALSDALSWGVETSGLGANPSAVNAAYTNFVIANGNATTAAAWTLGTGSKVIVGNGSAVTLTVADNFPITGTIDATATGVVVWKHLLSSPTFGELNNDSEVHFQPAAAAFYGLGNGTAYGKLFFDGAGKVSVSAGATISTATVKNALIVAAGSTLDFPVTNTHSITINGGASATIYGTIKAGKQGGFAGTVAGGATTTTVSILLATATSILTLDASSTIDYYRPNAAQTISALPSGVNYANLILSETGCTAATSKVIPTTGITVNGTLTISLAGVAFASTTANADKITLANGATIVRTLGTLNAAPLYSGTYNVTYNGTTAQTTGFELPTAASAALNNLTFDNAAGVTLGAATTGNSIIANKSNAITLDTADYLNANVQMNGASELTLNVNANQANLKQIVFSAATSAKLKLNVSTAVTAVFFTAASVQNWGTGTVEITGFVEGKIKFGNSSTALTLNQLGLIKDMGDLSKTFKLSDQGYLYYSNTLVPGDAIVVTSANPLYLAVGVASTYSITATNSPTNFVLADPVNSPLPAGLTLNATTGAIEGTPTVAVTNFVVPITLTNSVSTTNTINFTFNVKTRDSQTITWNQNFPTTNTYGDAAITLTATTSSPLAVSYTSSNLAVATINGGTLTIVGPGTTTVKAMQAGDPDYAPATDITKELVVNAKPLTIAGATAMGKVYNKLNTATITGTLAGGIVGADVVTLVLSATYADANTGENKPVTSTSTLTGADASKYSLTQPTGLFATITKADQLLAALGTSSFKILGDADYDPIPLVTDANVTGVASVDVENPNFTYTSSNESVATIVGGKVHIVSLGTTIITGQQAGSINYNASLPVSQTLKVLPVPLVAWDLYNFNPTSVQQSVSSLTASQVAAGISVTPSLSMGNMNIITNAGNRYRFTSSDWPYAISSGAVAPINIETGKYMSVAIAADAGKSMSLSSINASFRGGAISSELLSQFAYSIDNGATFTAIGSPTTFTGVSGTRFYSDIDLSGIAALQNLPSGTTVILRYYASGKSNVTTSTAGQKAWGFFSDFVQNNTRALIIGGSLITLPPPPNVSDQAFCTGTLVSALFASGTSIKWYANANTTSVLNPSTPLTTGTYYATQTINGVESLRAAVFVTLNNSVAGIISGNQTIITGTIPTNITLGNYTGAIQWQSSTNGVTFSNINGATNPTLSGATIGELTVNTYIRAVVTSGSCDPAYSGVSTITITCCKFKFSSN
jgi:hypothetical protein